MEILQHIEIYAQIESVPDIRLLNVKNVTEQEKSNLVYLLYQL